MSAQNDVGHLSERDAALEALEDAVEHARSGGGSLTFLLGEAGLGKTSLVTLVRGWAKDLRVGFGEGVAAEAALPFGFLTQALGPLGGFDGLEAVEGFGSAEAKAALYYRTARWLEGTTAGGPLVLVFDDLHWADPDSLNLLGFLCRRLPDALTMVATLRPWPPQASTTAEALVAEGRARMERLAPLGDEAAAALLTLAAGRDLSSSEAREVLDSCAGNPLLLEQAGSAIRTEPVPQDGRPPRRRSQRPGRLLVSRFGGLPASVLHVVQAASVFGARFDGHLVSMVAGVSHQEADEALSALIEAGLARGLEGGQVEFVHPLFAQAIYDDLAAPTRRRLHGLAMRTLITNGAPPAEAAVHARAGHLVGDPKAIAVLEAAGRAALATGGIESALIDLRSAVELAGTTAAASLLLALADAELAAGHVEAAVTMCEQLLTNQSDPSMHCAVHVTQARASFLAGRPDVAGHYFQAAADAASDPNQAFSVLLEAAALCTTVAGPRQVLAWAEQARELARVTPDVDSLLANLSWGLVAALLGDPAGAELFFEAFDAGTLTTALQTYPPASAIWLAFSAMWVGMMTERFDLAERAFTVGWDVAQSLGSPLHLTVLGGGRSAILWRTGRLEELAALREEIEAVSANLDPEFSLLTYAAKALCELEADQTDKADASCVELAEGFLIGQRDHHPFMWLWMWKIKVELALDAGHVDDAVDLVDSMRALVARAGLLQPCTQPWADSVMDAYLRAGRLGDVRSLIEHLDSASAGWTSRWPQSVIARGRAGLAEAAGDTAAADGHHRWAVELLEEGELPLARARALIDHGTFLRRTGQPARARDPLARAAHLAGGCGAVRLERLALTELRACGGRRRRNTTELSPQELRVARLAAQGATNAQIAAALVISVKTVEHHLSTAYAKLGIRSRRELGAHVAQ